VPDRELLAKQTGDERAVSARTLKRIRFKVLLHEQWTLVAVGGP